jgi:hypothetical protein
LQKLEIEFFLKLLNSCFSRFISKWFHQIMPKQTKISHTETFMLRNIEMQRKAVYNQPCLYSLQEPSLRKKGKRFIRSEEKPEYGNHLFENSCFLTNLTYNPLIFASCVPALFLLIPSKMLLEEHCPCCHIEPG